jgi:hypothetical protein
MNYSEAVAKRVLESILPGATLVYRTAQANGEYDFDLRYSDGTVAAVEVTAAVDQNLTETIAAVRSKKKGGSIIEATVCKKSWKIFPAKGASINAIRVAADGSLAHLEHQGIDRFYCVSTSPSVRNICCQLQVTGGRVISSETEPTIRIAFPIGGGAVGAATATTTGERESWKPDNRKKLGAATTAERHLVVYLDAGNRLPWTALTSFAPPSTVPGIPDEVTNLWLIGQGENENEFVVWYANKNEIWRCTTAVCAPANVN